CSSQSSDRGSHRTPTPSRIFAIPPGAPPHGGLAFGLDRLVMILRNEDSIRETIAFPKTQKGFCPLSEAPGPVDWNQLRDLYIKVDFKPKE
ncbi:MAG: hypothetical protein NC902_04200, partial [Candidatus Omnitrophica bacterium]|nr:hypothetical protein [Candidatus Omnitrophota bacterium]